VSALERTGSGESFLTDDEDDDSSSVVEEGETEEEGGRKEGRLVLAIVDHEETGREEVAAGAEAACLA
jgi:hypothetical protein